MFKFKFPPPDHNSIYEICYSTSSDTTSGHEHGPGPGVSPNLRFEFPASWPGPNWAGTPRLELVSRERASRRPRGPLADPLPLDLRRGMPQSVESSALSVFSLASADV